MDDKIGMAIADADGNILREYDFEKFKEDMERSGAILFEVLVEKYGEEFKDEFAEVINSILANYVNLWMFKVATSKKGAKVLKLAVEHKKYRTRKKNKKRFWKMVKKERAKSER